MILSLQHGLVEEGFKVSLVKLCPWFEMPRRTVYYRSTKAALKVQEHFLKSTSLALVINCYSRELLGWHLSHSGRSKTAEAALEQALIARDGCLGKVKHPFLLRSDNGLVFTSRSYTALVKSYGLQQEFITPYSPEQNGMVERVIRTLKDQCVHRHRFETLQHASRVIADWIGFYNHRRPHQALGMKTPAEAYALAA